MMTKSVRKYTVALLEAMDAGMLDPKQVAEMCLGAMSDDDVGDMCQANELGELLELDGDDSEDE